MHDILYYILNSDLCADASVVAGMGTLGYCVWERIKEFFNDNFRAKS